MSAKTVQPNVPTLRTDPLRDRVLFVMARRVYASRRDLCHVNGKSLVRERARTQCGSAAHFVGYGCRADRGVLACFDGG
jgi:hypothetical protein